MTWLWLQQWRLDRHPYLKLENEASGGTGFVLAYSKEVLGKRVWYSILTPYRTDFDGEVKWEEIDSKGSSIFLPEISEGMTADIARQIAILRE